MSVLAAAIAPDVGKSQNKSQRPSRGRQPSLKGLREIDQIATKVSKTIDGNDRGIIRTVSSGGGMTTGEIARWNEDVEPICTYCMAEENDIDHLIWDCPFFNKVRIEQDPLLASIPSNCLLTCIKRGIAPAMELEGNKTFWGQDLNDTCTNEQLEFLGKHQVRNGMQR